MGSYSVKKYATQSADFPVSAESAPRSKTYSTIAQLPADGGSVGSTAFVTSNLKMYMWNGIGWYLIATVTNSSPSSITGVDGTYALENDGTATTITAIATDPEGFPLTWSYAVTTGSLGSTATVSQADNVFTITPSSTEADAGSFSLTFNVTDGVNASVSAVSAFTLAFGSWATPTLMQTILNRNEPTPAAYQRHGKCIGISDEGTMVVGSNTDGINIYILVSGTWTWHSNIAGSYTQEFCGISIDGNTIATGAETGGSTNAITIYVRSGSGASATWASQQTWSVSGEPSVVLSGDGNTVAYGNYDATSNELSQCKVQVYQRSGTTWTQQTVPTPTQVTNAGTLPVHYGRVIGISNDGNRLVAGAYYLDHGSSNTNAGGVFVSDRSGSTWSTPTLVHYISASNLLGNDATTSGKYGNFGYYCNISGDGNYIIAGKEQNTNPSSSYIFALVSGVWTEVFNIPHSIPTGQTNSWGAASNPEGMGAGHFNTDATILCVPYRQQNSGTVNQWQGGVMLWKRENSTWTQFSEKVYEIDTDFKNQEQNNQTIVMSRNGEYFAVGRQKTDSPNNSQIYVGSVTVHEQG